MRPLVALAVSGFITGAAAVPPSVILITLDGVRWQDVVGPSPLSLPNLTQHFAEEGALLGGDDNSRITVANPSYVSLPGYRELFTGHVDQSCQTNHCQPLLTPTVLDRAVEEGSGPVVTIASWEGIRAATSGSSTPGFLRSAGRQDPMAIHLVERLPEVAELVAAGDKSPPSPGKGQYRPDLYTEKLALAALVQLQPRLMVVSLGDTDEWAHHNDLRRYRDSLRSADRFIGAVVHALAGLGTYGAHATVIVTTDHGRSRRFHDHGGHSEAGRIWLGVRGSSIQTALVFAPLPDRPGNQCAGGALTLGDVAPMVGTLLGLDPLEFDADGQGLAFLLGGPRVAEVSEGL